ncbi:MAG: hypothetical protein Q4Q62_06010 [Thermoplasmata archaeon]|nr:hypothetical protein [Thermoplasmata archaeon]
MREISMPVERTAKLNMLGYEIAGIFMIIGAVCALFVSKNIDVNFLLLFVFSFMGGVCLIIISAGSRSIMKQAEKANPADFELMGECAAISKGSYRILDDNANMIINLKRRELLRAEKLRELQEREQYGVPPENDTRE